MKKPDDFICIDYGKTGFLIPQKDVFTAGFCSPSDFKTDSNGSFVHFGGILIPFVNLDEFWCNKAEEERGRTSVIIKNTSLFKDSDYFALITSALCCVKSIFLSEFSLFSSRIALGLQKKGIAACYFHDEAVCYLVDANEFLAGAV